jgi:signal transduction histidine kinase
MICSPKLNIRVRLLGGFILALIMTVLAGSTGILSLQRISNKMTDVTDQVRVSLDQQKMQIRDTMFFEEFVGRINSARSVSDINEVDRLLRLHKDHCEAGKEGKENHAIVEELVLLKKKQIMAVDRLSQLSDMMKVKSESIGKNVVEMVDDIGFDALMMEDSLTNAKSRSMGEEKESRDDIEKISLVTNQINNGKEALLGNEKEEKWMIVRSYPYREDRLRIEVTDNGVGISKENMTKIFQHGFTTKEKGHGFGLHSGALAAREMGGSLTVHSDGPGHGATFTLELPINISETVTNECSQ